MNVVETDVKIVTRRKARFSSTVTNPAGEKYVMYGRLRRKDVLIQGSTDWWNAIPHHEVEATIDILLAAKAELDTQKIQQEEK